MSRAPAPSKGRRLRHLALVLGFAVLFFWLPLEDTSERPVVLISTAISALAAAALLGRFSLPSNRRWWVFSIAGVLAGIAITPLALILMALKTGLHGHGIPDFSPTQALLVIQKTPVWAGAGFLVGLGAGLWPRPRARSE